MLRTRHVVGAVVTAAVALPVIAISPASAAGPVFGVTAPADVASADAVWYAGETHDIEWTVDTETGAYTLELWSSGASPARIATIGSGTDITDRSYRWTIPSNLAGLLAENAVVKVKPQSGAAAQSDQFDLRRSAIEDVAVVEDASAGSPVAVTEAVPGGSYDVTWDSVGVPGETVKIDLLRTVSGSTRVTSLVSSAVNDGEAEVTIPSRALPDAAAGTYTIKVTPAHAFASAASTGTFKVVRPTVTLTSQGSASSVSAGKAVPVTWTHTGGAPVRIDAKPASGRSVTIASSATGGSFTWYPAATGVYDIVVTDVRDRSLADTSTAKVTVTANTEQLYLNSHSDDTITLGESWEMSWAFSDPGPTLQPELTVLPVDITLVSETGRRTPIARSTVGTTGYTNGVVDRLRELTWQPPASIAPGRYFIELDDAGSVPGDVDRVAFPVTLEAPTSLTLSNFVSSSFEAGAQPTLQWSIDGGSKLPVVVSLVPATGREVVLARPGQGESSATVTIPATTAAGSYSIKVATVAGFGPSRTPLSATRAITVTAPTLTLGAVSGLKNGAQANLTWTYADDSRLPVKLELFKGSSTRPAVVIARSAPTTGAGFGGYAWTVPAGLRAGSDYVVKATVLGPSGTPQVVASSPVTVAPPVLVVDTPSGPVTGGEIITLTWDAVGGGDQSVTVSLVKGTTVVARIADRALTTAGSGTLSWIVPTSLAAGSDYTIRITDNAQPTSTDDSSTFSIRANETVIG